ncbi:MAG: hypothetical protein U5J99_14185 [Parvularculaceae bacterium]|nr:hypothetical protein [Parvularculaceae bacterium]
MLKPILAAALVLASLAPAYANETADACRSYVEENGGDASGCDCLGEAASGDADLAAALAAIEAPEDIEAADDATKAAIAACFPNAG